MGRTGSPAAGVRATLKTWAANAGCAIDEKGYVRSLEANFFEPLSACTHAEFAMGDGAELGKNGAVGKIQALHSSAALACNVFDYWRGRDTAALAQALGTPGRFCSIQFEAKFPTGLGGKAPNLDLLLGRTDGAHIAVESKFLEPYGGAKPRLFKEKYFPEGPGLWERVGLPQAERVARQLREKPDTFLYLDAQQLLKHLLGLAQREGTYSLLYLWYDVGGDAGSAHEEEVRAFLSALSGARVPLSSRTYPSLYQGLSDAGGAAHRSYLDYLGRRYFSSVGA